MSDANKIIGIENKNIIKVNGIEGKNILSMGGTLVKFEQIPAGLIIFLNDTNVPENWEAFNSANGRVIYGAGLSYSIGQTGGSTSIGGSYTSGTAGYHTAFAEGPAYGGSTFHSTSYKGDHTHPVSGISASVYRKSAIMIRSTKDNDTYPVNALLFSKAPLSGLTNNTSYNNKYLIGGTSITDYPSSGSCSLTTAGAHNHFAGSLDRAFSGAGGVIGVRGFENTSGDHSSSGNALSSVSDNLRRILLSLWTHASLQFEMQPNMIAMWESLTPPDGWLLCNGDNGTPDLRNYCIKPVSSGAENINQQGLNQISVSGSATQAQTHGHDSYYQTQQVQSQGRHRNTANSHAHAVSVSNASYIPPYYALSFIMKAA